MKNWIANKLLVRKANKILKKEDFRPIITVEEIGKSTYERTDEITRIMKTTLKMVTRPMTSYETRLYDVDYEKAKKIRLEMIIAELKADKCDEQCMDEVNCIHGDK